MEGDSLERDHMTTYIVRLETKRITDETTFHEVFADIMGVPGFYGHNQDAWIDCMGYLDEPEAEMTRFTLPAGEMLYIHVIDTEDFQQRLPTLFRDFIECTAFVNRRRTDAGSPPLLSLVFL